MVNILAASGELVQTFPNGPGGFIIEYNVGKVIGTDISGKAVNNIKVNVRDGVINTAFPF